MQFRRFIPVLIGAAMGAVPLCAHAQKTPAAAPLAAVATDKPTKIAIVNPSRVFAEMQETKTLKEKLEIRRKELQNKEMEQRQTIDTLIQARGQVKPDHPKYREMTEQIELQKAQLQIWGITTKASFDRDQKNNTKTLYDKIEVAVAEVAVKQGIDLVIADGRQEVTNIEELTPENLRQWLNSRNILFSNKSVDITETVITVLDKNFAQAGPGGGPALPPPINTPGTE